ncbi:glycoside hydrolase family protein [Treponema pedis]
MELPPLSQNEFDALVSLGFNVGRHELVNSEIFDYAEVTDPSYFKNKHDSSVYEKAITNKFREYNNANKKYSLGLDKRRIDEAEMFFYGDYIRDNKRAPLKTYFLVYLFIILVAFL